MGGQTFLFVAECVRVFLPHFVCPQNIHLAPAQFLELDKCGVRRDTVKMYTFEFWFTHNLPKDHLIFNIILIPLQYHPNYGE